MVVVDTLNAAAKTGVKVSKLLLRCSEDLRCKNMMCAKFDIEAPAACVCKLARFVAQNNFSQLTHLDISANGIDVLPDALFDCLPQLQVLNVGDNKLKSLPIQVIKLKNLSSLDLSNNHLRQLPYDELMTMGHLTHLLLSGNPSDVLRGVPDGLSTKITY